MDEIRCEPGSLVAHPGGHEHANRTGPTGARCVNVEFSDALRSDPALRPLSGREQVLRLPPLHPALCRLRFALTLQDISAALSTLAATLEVVCAATSAPAAGKGQRWLRGVVDQIEADLMHDHSLQELAKRAGVHVSQLVRSFKRDHGESIGGYLRRRRLEVANARLITEDTPLAEIALDAGFCDQSHFTRAYARQFGSTPGQRRRLLRS